MASPAKPRTRAGKAGHGSGQQAKAPGKKVAKGCPFKIGALVHALNPHVEVVDVDEDPFLIGRVAGLHDDADAADQQLLVSVQVESEGAGFGGGVLSRVQQDIHPLQMATFMDATLRYGEERRLLVLPHSWLHIQDEAEDQERFKAMFALAGHDRGGEWTSQFCTGWDLMRMATAGELMNISVLATLVMHAISRAEDPGRFLLLLDSVSDNLYKKYPVFREDLLDMAAEKFKDTRWFEIPIWIMLAFYRGHFSAVILHGMDRATAIPPFLIHLDSIAGCHEEKFIKEGIDRLIQKRWQIEAPGSAIKPRGVNYFCPKSTAQQSLDGNNCGGFTALHLLAAIIRSERFSRRQVRRPTLGKFGPYSITAADGEASRKGIVALLMALLLEQNAEKVDDGVRRAAQRMCLQNGISWPPEQQLSGGIPDNLCRLLKSLQGTPEMTTKKRKASEKAKANKSTEAKKLKV